MMNVSDTVQDKAPSGAKCLHCDSRLSGVSTEKFCCNGCRLAYELITSSNLEAFYNMLPEGSLVQPTTAPKDADYALFDTKDYQEGFWQEAPGGQQDFHFFMSNLSCYACVWVCEQITRKIDPDAELRINMASGEARLSLSATSPQLSQFVKSYEALGFAITPNRQAKTETKASLRRLGVAFFCLMNVMMLAFPEYLDNTSLAPEFRKLFRGLSALLAGIAVFYAGRIFLKNALLSLRHFVLRLDLPIGLALTVGYFYSVRNMILGAPHVYFDTMTAVVSLLLTGQFFQRKALERITREQARFLEADVYFARLVEGGERRLIPLKEVKEGQTIEILPGEVLPVEGRLVTAHCVVSYGLLKGESQETDVVQGTTILAGAVNGSGRVEIEATQAGTESFLLEIKESANRLTTEKGRYLTLSEKMAQFFVFFTLTAAFSVGLYFLPSDSEEAFRRFSAVLLVACPCVFGFGAPMVISKAFQLALEKGVLFRSQKALEGLQGVKRFYFDKTGTLTEELAGVADVQWNFENLKTLAVDLQDVFAILRSLAAYSNHHIPAALKRWSLGHDEDRIASGVEFESVHEDFGFGLSLLWKGLSIRVGRASFCFEEARYKDHSLSYMTIEGLEVFSFRLDEVLKKDVPYCIDRLVKSGKELHILSGDHPHRVSLVGGLLNIRSKNLRNSLSPEDKLNEVLYARNAAMVGNGYNDILASSAAPLGIALENATDALKSASDISFRRPGLYPLLIAIEISSEARRVMKRCFLFALGFNVLALSLALSGIVTPVMAAILMPLSSLTVFLSSQKFSLSSLY